MCGTRKVKHKKVKVVLSVIAGMQWTFPKDHIYEMKSMNAPVSFSTRFLKTSEHHNYDLEINRVNNKVQPLCNVMARKSRSQLAFYLYY